MERETLRISRSYCASTSTFSWNSIRKARFHEITCKGSKVEFNTRICSIAEEDIYCIGSSVVNIAPYAKNVYESRQNPAKSAKSDLSTLAFSVGLF